MAHSPHGRTGQCWPGKWALLMGVFTIDPGQGTGQKGLNPMSMWGSVSLDVVRKARAWDSVRHPAGGSWQPVAHCHFGLPRKSINLSSRGHSGVTKELQATSYFALCMYFLVLEIQSWWDYYESSHMLAGKCSYLFLGHVCIQGTEVTRVKQRET